MGSAGSKGMEMNASENSISFVVNGTLHEVDNPEIGMSLNTWLRSKLKMTGTKSMCYEGGCGSCVVMVTRHDPTTDKDTSLAVNSCLFPLMSADGCQVVTTEGLITSDGDYHDIQKRMAQFNATQCGYCTPGFVMTMYSLLQKNPNPTQEEIEAEFDGNICRCTGFRPIFDAMKTFASDADPKLKKLCEDIEDVPICTNKKKICTGNGHTCKRTCGRYHAEVLPSDTEKTWQHLISNKPLLLTRGSGEDSVVWVRPSTLDELTEAVKENAGKTIRFVVGNTSTGVFKNEGDFDVYIDTKLVKELYQVDDVSGTALRVGANFSLSSLIELLQQKREESNTFDVMWNHLKKIANVPVRNVGSWIGNLTMKRQHPEFPSDVCTLFVAYSVKLIIRDCATGVDGTYEIIGQDGFLSLDMTGKVVIAAEIPKYVSDSTGSFRALSYKVMPRSQNAHAYVNAAFLAKVQDGIVVGAPTLVFGGISKTFFHATETENYLAGKAVSSQDVLSGALQVFQTEVKPEIYSAADSSVEYRESLASGLFYKFYLTLGDASQLSPDVVTASEIIQRPVTSATQSYSTDATMYPVTEAMPKVTAIKQASGEAKYTSDLSALSDELFARFVTSTVANADIDAIDKTEAESMAGCKAIITASDLPSTVKNNCMPPLMLDQVLIAESHVDFAGQPVAIVVADSEANVRKIAAAVKVTYKNQKPGVYDVSEAMAQGHYVNGHGQPVVIGDADTAINNAKHKVTGTIKLGEQYHFYMETQICRARPTEDGFDVESATQWQANVQATLANMLGWDYNRFNIITHRVGGAYGGKAPNSYITASAATLASYMVGKPVRMHVDLSTCMETYGTRPAYVAEYSAGFDDTGVLEGVDITYISNCGSSANGGDVFSIFIKEFADSAYHCDNWKLTPKWVLTNMACATWCRAPCSLELSIIIEKVVEHVAKSLSLDPTRVKLSNLYQVGQTNLFNEPLTYCNIRTLSDSLLESADATNRQSQIDSFNAANKWKKRGLAFSPIKFGVIWNGVHFSAQVSIYAKDGSVVIFSSGVESGQGINTKHIQVAAYTLGAPLDLIRVKEVSTLCTPNTDATGGSVTSELVAKAVLEACKTLKSRLEESRMAHNLPDTTPWAVRVRTAYSDGKNLTAQNMYHPESELTIQYNTYGAACSEVELDIITGEHVIRRVDILYDCGKSMNPDIDIGQTEGAFLMGVGFFTSEKYVYDTSDGRLVTRNTWEYKPPASKDIPTEWNVTLLKDAPNPNGILSSKAVGEPPLLTSASVFFAIKRCIEAFRKDGFFALDVPATVSDIQQACKILTSDFTL